MINKSYNHHGINNIKYLICYKKLDNIDIRIVVNNAGIDFIDKINDLKLKDIIRMI